MASSRNASFPNLSSVQDSIRGLRSEGEKVFTRALEEVETLIGDEPRKAVRHWVDQAAAVRKDVEKRADKTLRSMRARAEKLRCDIDARKALEPIARRLSLPTKHEVDRLAKRLSSLEKKVDQLLRARS